MTKKFSIRPTLTIRGRKFKGLRGWAGKPFHPPLTDIPIGAYVIAAGLDILSRVFREHGRVGTHSSVLGVQLNRAAGWCLIAGLAVSLLATLTGWADWHRSSQVGTQARRTINTHAGMMIVGTLLVVADLVLRYGPFAKYGPSPIKLAALTAFLALWVSVAATYGGSLVFDYGFNVETSGDHPVWHESEQDVFPADH